MTRFAIRQMLVCLVSLLGSFCAKSDAQVEPAKGWAVILASDYEGENGKLYSSVQRDALTSYRFAVETLHLRMDHIFLLAKGDLIKKAVAGEATFNTSDKDHFRLRGKDMPDADAPDFVPGLAGDPWLSFRRLAKKDRDEMKAKLIERHLLVDGARTRNKSFYDESKEKQMIAWQDNPTRSNFRLVMKFLKENASADDFVLIIASTRAKSGGPDEALFYTDPEEDEAKSYLTKEDFDLKGCKARTKLLMADATNPGDLSPDFQPLSGKRYDLRDQLRSGGGEGIVLVAGDNGDRSYFDYTLPLIGGDTSEGEGGSAFLKCLRNEWNGTLEIKEGPDDRSGEKLTRTLERVGQAVQQRFRAMRKKVAQAQKLKLPTPVAYGIPSEWITRVGLQETTVRTPIHEKIETTKREISVTPDVSPMNGEKSFTVNIHQARIYTPLSVGHLDSEERCAIIVARLQTLLKKGILKASDIYSEKASEPSRDYDIKAKLTAEEREKLRAEMPTDPVLHREVDRFINTGILFSVKQKEANVWGQPLDGYAQMKANGVRSELTVDPIKSRSIHTKGGGDVTFLLNQVSEALKQSPPDYEKAERCLLKALGQDSSKPQLFLNLAGVQLSLNQKRKALETLDALETLYPDFNAENEDVKPLLDKANKL